MSGAHEPPSECAALMAKPSAKEVAELLCGTKKTCACQRAQGTSASEQVDERRKIRDALVAKPLPELRSYGKELRDRYAALLARLKQKPTVLSVPWNLYEGWLSDLDARLAASADAEKAGNEAEAKRQLALLYFDVKFDIEKIKQEIDEPVGDIEQLLGRAVNATAKAVDTVTGAVVDAGRVARNVIEGTDQKSLGDRVLPTLGTGTKVVLGLAAGAMLLRELRPVLEP